MTFSSYECLLNCFVCFLNTLFQAWKFPVLKFHEFPSIFLSYTSPALYTCSIKTIGGFEKVPQKHQQTPT